MWWEHGFLTDHGKGAGRDEEIKNIGVEGKGFVFTPTCYCGVNTSTPEVEAAYVCLIIHNILKIFFKKSHID